MIISESVIVKPNNHSIKHYLNKGYDAKCKQEILIKVEDLTKSSRVRVACKCEKCGNITNIKYQDYNTCICKNNFYVCDKCKYEKIKITNKNKYGRENYNNINKIKYTMNNLYGCDFPLQNNDIKERKEKTCINKYGFKNASENKEVKNKISQSNIKNFENIEIKDNIVKKRKKTCFEKYGDENYTRTEGYKIKSEETCIKKYGVKHNGSVPEFIFKRRLTYYKNNYKDRSEYYLYRKEVRKITNKYTKKLFESWNGYDYYDNEYIADNFKFKSGSSSYPSIDHKISIYYGFKNNIEPEVIGKIDNLCITKRSINSSKKDKNSI